MIHMNYPIYGQLFFSIILLITLFMGGFIIIFSSSYIINFIAKLLFKKNLTISKLLKIVTITTFCFIILYVSWWTFSKPGHRFIFYSKAIEGKVLDQETGKPIEGANVVAVWIMDHFIEKRQGIANIEETVTDSNGHFKLSGWVKFSLDLTAMMRYPDVTIFKPGYCLGGIPEFRSPDYRFMYIEDTRRKAEINKTGIFKMEKFEGDLEDWAKKLSKVEGAVRMSRVIEYELEDNIRNLIKALKQESKKIEEESKGKVKAYLEIDSESFRRFLRQKKKFRQD